MTPDFIPGIQLNEAFYWEAVRPILDHHFPGLAHSAALIGRGSDVLGYDTAISRDHGWGPRMTLFLDPAHFYETRSAVNEALRQGLPVNFRGYSTHFSAPDPLDNGMRQVHELEHGPVDHLIQIDTIPNLWQALTSADPFQLPAPATWLTFEEQTLLTLTAGKVFHDGLGLESVRERFSYYPRDVWLYLIASQWQLISQEEAFVGRTHSVGDELGSAVIAARQAHQLMGLCFLFEKRYAPYSKWFGFAFKRLSLYPRMGPLLEGVLRSASYSEREVHLALAYTLAVDLLNDLAIIPLLDSQTRTYSGWHMLRAGVTDLPLDDARNTRPHRVIFAGRIADAVYAAIGDPGAFPPPPYTGSVNQFMVPSSDALQTGLIPQLWRKKIAASASAKPWWD